MTALEDARAFELGDPRFAIALVEALVDALHSLGTELADLPDHGEQQAALVNLTRERLDVERAILDELVRLGRALERIGGRV